ncbi:MAG: class I SAM-dependent methyltransferase [Candidatus Pacebacteria bacterium]|nr:class I SAM-dependent methyltransferase [Candidatus Paceibacterota bacterium]
MKHIIQENEKTWDVVANLFMEASHLPVWGPFGVGDDLNLIPEIKGKRFLEIGCGSGRSIKYLTDNGSEKVHALDLSASQIEEARKFNEEGIELGKVEVFKGAMEDKLNIDPVDVVFSVYGIGWTTNPKVTFGNIHAYLKTGGTFIWSWDHTIFTDVQYKEGQYVVEYSYHDEELVTLRNWKERGVDAHITYRKTATWFKLLRETGFEVVGYYEPKPKTNEERYWDPQKYYSIEKANKIPATFIFVCKKI